MKLLLLEKSYPLLLATVSAAAAYYFDITFPKDEWKEFLSAALSLGAILTGFIATAKAILASMPSDSVMGQLRSTGYIYELVSYLKQALHGCLFFSIFCLLGFFLVDKNILPLLYRTIWVFAAVFSGLAFYRVSNLLFLVIQRDTKK
jgi:O-antigen/teichoic acid export membrane protein